MDKKDPMRVNQIKAYWRGMKRKVFFLFSSLFLRNNKIIKCRKHCVRFELATEDTRYKAFEGREHQYLERDQKKKKKKISHEAVAKAFFYLDDSLLICWRAAEPLVSVRRKMPIFSLGVKGESCGFLPSFLPSFLPAPVPGGLRRLPCCFF
jgi:hypothetical protein